MLNAERVIEINNFIDRVHTPILWAFPVVLGIFCALEIFLPEKVSFENQFDAFYSWLKFDLIIFTSLISASQGFSGGCLIQIPQNYLAQEYLGRDWLPYGLVFRENFDPSYWWVLRLAYFLAGLLAVFIYYIYWKKRIKNPTSKVVLG